MQRERPSASCQVMSPLDSLARTGDLERLFLRHFTSREISNVSSTSKALRDAVPEASWQRLCNRRWPWASQLVRVASFREFYSVHARLEGGSLASRPLAREPIQFAVALHDGENVLACDVFSADDAVEPGRSGRSWRTRGHSFEQTIHVGRIPGYSHDVLAELNDDEYDLSLIHI